MSLRSATQHHWDRLCGTLVPYDAGLFRLLLQVEGCSWCVQLAWRVLAARPAACTAVLSPLRPRLLQDAAAQAPESVCSVAQIVSM